MEPLLFVVMFISFFCTFLLMPYWIKKAKSNGLIGKDMQKVDKREVAEGGGLVILFGFALGILLYIAIRTFYFKSANGILINIFALLCVLLLSSFVGIVDDLMGWKKGLSKKIRILIVLFSAVPLMVINAGNSIMMGIDFGILYPLLIIPLGILGATTTFNFLAGYNGLEAGQGILILFALAITTWLTGNSWLSVIALCMVAALFAFYIFNMYPAKIFPGDILTYSVGALIAVIAILGNIEKIALFFFIPYIIETGLKIKGKLKKESFAEVNEDGSLELRYKKIYSLTHLSLLILKKFKDKVYERDVVYLIHGFQIAIIILGFLIFF